ncbi:MAG: hypothetical protein AAGF23_00090 [Acidobacteriota bacterium]
MKPHEENQRRVTSGLRFFAAQTPVTRRRRRFLFVLAWCGISAMLMWPIYPLMSGATPLVLGLPRSLAWILGAMVLMFAALLWLFLGDEAEAKDQRSTASEGSGELADG